MPANVWWKRGVVYQIYPRSFQDTNADGIGDLDGIRRRLDYLAWLQVDAIWISPIYPSPMKDFGYDVADYCGVDPIFCTLSDFDRLVEEAHARGLKLILDFVPNHTSDRHPWFVESRASREGTCSPPMPMLASTRKSAVCGTRTLNWPTPPLMSALTSALSPMSSLSSLSKLPNTNTTRQNRKQNSHTKKQCCVLKRKSRQNLKPRS